MRLPLLFRFLFLGFTLISSKDVFGQTDAAAKSLEVYQKSYQALMQLLGNFHISKGTDELHQALTYKVSNVQQILSSASRPSYFASDTSSNNCMRLVAKDYDNYASLLSRAQVIKNIDTANAVLSYIRSDLQIKGIGSWTIAGPRRIGVVKIVVKVLDKKTRKELPGFHVFIKPALALDPRFTVPLNPTNDATKDILPGLRTIWAVDDKGKIIGSVTDGIRWSENIPPYIFEYAAEKK